VLVTARMTQMDTLGTPTPPPTKGLVSLKNESILPRVSNLPFGFICHWTKIYIFKTICYNDSYLFPAVFGLEAMAQVVAQVTGVIGFRGVRVENLVLRRPIIVDPEKGADIIVWAQTRERAAAGDKLAVQAGIFKAGADPNADFFSATFVMGSMDSPAQQPLDFPREPLDMKPPTDLYRQTLLFQGSRFQRIDQVHVLERHTAESGTVVVSTPPPDPDCAKLAFASPEHQRFLLGDPFQRDNLLQSAALLIPQDTSLPLSIRRWDIYPDEKSHPNITACLSERGLRVCRIRKSTRRWNPGSNRCAHRKPVGVSIENPETS
jgi:enediyne polyketide synthase